MGDWGGSAKEPEPFVEGGGVRLTLKVNSGVPADG